VLHQFGHVLQASWLIGLYPRYHRLKYLKERERGEGDSREGDSREGDSREGDSREGDSREGTQIQKGGIVKLLN